ncbi:MAG: electron transfer flavoprotein-ubiquinone oxidoreductase [Bdellovibrionaceae bacterium]|nr:electron transfer flavoprotein-ubiquinone oxidoreductase [Pseudobdellovibrionaceae bacterium]
MTEAIEAEIQREEMDVDVLIVGGGCAGLAAAYHLASQIEKHNAEVAAGTRTGSSIPDQMIVVLDKGSEIGAHSLSGAVMNPSAIREMIPDYRERGAPIEADVVEDAVYYLGHDFKVKAPVTPPPFVNHGNQIISLSKFNRWLGAQCEAKGINIFPGFSAVEALYDGDRIVGVRTGDKGRDKMGRPKSNFEPGMLLKSKVTIFAEGTRGSLFKQVAKRLDLMKDRNPDVYEEGVKEIVQMPPGTVTPGKVIHTLGFPLYKGVGGTFIYTLPNDQIIVGLVGYLDTKDPLFDPHRELQKLKTHPFLREMLQGGKVIAYGGKTLPAGGWYSMPKLYADGMMVIGDSASMVDVKKLKGIHLGIKSGMLAAETALDAILKQDFSAATLAGYERRVNESVIKTELWKTRNFHQTLSMGAFQSMPFLALQEITGGRGLWDRMKIEHTDSQATHETVEVWGPKPLEREENQLPKPDGVLFFDKLSSVYLTGTMHDEDSPNHLLLKNPRTCSDHCGPKYNSPCTHFCPAAVYEMVPDSERPGHQRLQINFTNCIHCKTCDIKCPTDNIDWTPPEGGGGPQYKET